MKQAIHFILFSLAFLLIKPCAAQDIHFSQFTETPLLRNPAFAGLFNGDLRIQGIFRNQWSAVTVPFQTSSASVEYKMHVGQGNDFLTVGGAVLYDKAGTIALTSTHVLPVLNYHQSLSDERNMYLSAGFSAGIVQRKLDASKMTTNNQYNGIDYDPSLSTGENLPNGNMLYFDGSAGISFNSQIGENPDNNLYVGVGYHHFNRSASVSFYDNSQVHIDPKLVFSAGLRMSVNDYAYTTFYGDYSTQGPYTEIMGGMLYSLKLGDFPDEPRYVISGGGFFRWDDAFVPVMKLEMAPLSFALSYDVNVSRLKAASQSQGGFELSLTFQSFSANNTSRDAVRCPRF